MTTSEEQVHLIAKWVVESITAEQVDRLIDHVTEAEMETDETHELGETFIDALNEVVD